MIEVKNLVKRYGNFTAVNGISFTLEPGKIYGFLGPNGAGKSTTMNIMTGYIAATSGDVSIYENDILEDAEEAKSIIGYLPEIPPVYPEMTVEEYIRFVAEMKHIKKSERRNEVNRVIAKTHLEEYRRRLIRNLSKGYRQRVGLAQAILGKPKFIILDEPTVGLDPRQILEIRCLIRELVASDESGEDKEEKPTVIFSSHIMQEVSAVCDEIKIIARGRLIAEGTPWELVDRFHTAEKIEVVIRTGKEEDALVISESKEEQFEMILKRVCPQASVTLEELEDGCSKYLLELEKGNDIREVIFKECAKEGIGLIQLNRIVPTLEEIFLELVHMADEQAELEEQNRAKEERIGMLLSEAKKEGITDVEGVSFSELEEKVFPELKEEEASKETAADDGEKEDDRS